MATQGPRVDLAWTREKAHVTKWQLTAVPGSVLSTQLRSSLSVSFSFSFFFSVCRQSRGVERAAGCSTPIQTKTLTEGIDFSSIQSKTRFTVQQVNHLTPPTLRTFQTRPIPSLLALEVQLLLTGLPECTHSIPPPALAGCPLPFPHEVPPSPTRSPSSPPPCANPDSIPPSRTTSPKPSPIPTMSDSLLPSLPADAPTLPISLAAGPNRSLQPPVLVP